MQNNLSLSSSFLSDRSLHPPTPTRLCEQKESLLEEAHQLEQKLAYEAHLAGAARPKTTVWQRSGVIRGESELDIESRVRAEQLEALRQGSDALRRHAPRDALLYLEQQTSALCVATAGLLGALYGGARGYLRAWRMDVTPSVCKELAGFAPRRSALGAMLLVGFFEAAPWLKTQALKTLNKPEITGYNQSGALEQLIAVDCAYIGAIAVLNFLFPYILVPVAFNPAQLLVLPSLESPPPPPESAAEAEKK